MHRGLQRAAAALGTECQCAAATANSSLRPHAHGWQALRNQHTHQPQSTQQPTEQLAPASSEAQQAPGAGAREDTHTDGIFSTWPSSSGCEVWGSKREGQDAASSSSIDARNSRNSSCNDSASSSTQNTISSSPPTPPTALPTQARHRTSSATARAHFLAQSKHSTSLLHLAATRARRGIEEAEDMWELLQHHLPQHTPYQRAGLLADYLSSLAALARRASPRTAGNDRPGQSSLLTPAHHTVLSTLASSALTHLQRIANKAPPWAAADALLAMSRLREAGVLSGSVVGPVGEVASPSHSPLSRLSSSLPLSQQQQALHSQQHLLISQLAQRCATGEPVPRLRDLSQGLQGLRGLGLGPLSYEWCTVQAALVRELQQVAHSTLTQTATATSVQAEIPPLMQSAAAALTQAASSTSTHSQTPQTAAATPTQTTTAVREVPITHSARDESHLDTLASTASTIAATHLALPRAHMLPLLHALSDACCGVLGRLQFATHSMPAAQSKRDDYHSTLSTPAAAQSTSDSQHNSSAALSNEQSAAEHTSNSSSSTLSRTEESAVQASASCAPRLLLSLCNLGLLGPAAPGGVELLSHLLTRGQSDLTRMQPEHAALLESVSLRVLRTLQNTARTVPTQETAYSTFSSARLHETAAHSMIGAHSHGAAAHSNVWSNNTAVTDRAPLFGVGPAVGESMDASGAVGRRAQFRSAQFWSATNGAADDSSMGASASALRGAADESTVGAGRVAFMAGSSWESNAQALQSMLRQLYSGTSSAQQQVHHASVAADTAATGGSSSASSSESSSGFKRDSSNSSSESSSGFKFGGDSGSNSSSSGNSGFNFGGGSQKGWKSGQQNNKQQQDKREVGAWIAATGARIAVMDAGITWLEQAKRGGSTEGAAGVRGGVEAGGQAVSSACQDFLGVSSAHDSSVGVSNAGDSSVSERVVVSSSKDSSCISSSDSEGAQHSAETDSLPAKHADATAAEATLSQQQTQTQTQTQMQAQTTQEIVASNDSTSAVGQQQDSGTQHSSTSGATPTAHTPAHTHPSLSSNQQQQPTHADHQSCSLRHFSSLHTASNSPISSAPFSHFSAHNFSNSSAPSTPFNQQHTPHSFAPPFSTQQQHPDHSTNTDATPSPTEQQQQQQPTSTNATSLLTKQQQHHLPPPPRAKVPSRQQIPFIDPPSSTPPTHHSHTLPTHTTASSPHLTTLQQLKQHAAHNAHTYSAPHAARTMVSLCALGCDAPDVLQPLMTQVMVGLHLLDPGLLCAVTKSASTAQLSGRDALYKAACHRVLVEEQQHAHRNASSLTGVASSRGSSISEMASISRASSSEMASGSSGSDVEGLSRNDSSGSCTSSSSDDLQELSSSTTTSSANGSSSCDLHFEQTEGQGGARFVADHRTSLLVFGLPFTMSHRGLRELLDEAEGVRGRYDFLHMPYTRHNRGPGTKRGYALINMKDAAGVEALVAHLHGRHITHSVAQPCHVTHSKQLVQSESPQQQLDSPKQQMRSLKQPKHQQQQQLKSSKQQQQQQEQQPQLQLKLRYAHNQGLTALLERASVGPKIQLSHADSNSSSNSDLDGSECSSVLNGRSSSTHESAQALESDGSSNSSESTSSVHSAELPRVGVNESSEAVGSQNSSSVGSAELPRAARKRCNESATSVGSADLPRAARSKRCNQQGPWVEEWEGMPGEARVLLRQLRGLGEQGVEATGESELLPADFSTQQQRQSLPTRSLTSLTHLQQPQQAQQTQSQQQTEQQPQHLQHSSSTSKKAAESGWTSGGPSAAVCFQAHHLVSLAHTLTLDGFAHPRLCAHVSSQVQRALSEGVSPGALPPLSPKHLLRALTLEAQQQLQGLQPPQQQQQQQKTPLQTQTQQQSSTEQQQTQLIPMLAHQDHMQQRSASQQSQLIPTLAYHAAIALSTPGAGSAVMSTGTALAQSLVQLAQLQGTAVQMGQLQSTTGQTATDAVFTSGVQELCGVGARLVEGRALVQQQQPASYHHVQKPGKKQQKSQQKFQQPFTQQQGATAALRVQDAADVVWALVRMGHATEERMFHALTEQILSAPAVPNPHTPYTQAALDTDAAFNQTPPPYLSSWLMALSPKRLVRVLWAFGSCAHFVTWRQPELAAALEHAVTAQLHRLSGAEAVSALSSLTAPSYASSELSNAVQAHLAVCYDLRVEDLLLLSRVLNQQQQLQGHPLQQHNSAGLTAHDLSSEQSKNVDEQQGIPPLIPEFLQRLWHNAVANTGLHLNSASDGFSRKGKGAARVGGMVDSVPALHEVLQQLRARSLQQQQGEQAGDHCGSLFEMRGVQDFSNLSPLNEEDCVDDADDEQPVGLRRLTPEQLQHLGAVILQASQRLQARASA